MKNKNNYHQMYELCKKHMHAYVLVETVDGSKIDGIITGLDDENVYMALPVGEESQTYQPEYMHGSHYMHEPQYMRDEAYHRQFGFGPFFGGPHFGPGFFPRRRFRRLVLPLAALAALSILPWY